jgi:hypothetical protein
LKFRKSLCLHLQAKVNAESAGRSETPVTRHRPRVPRIQLVCEITQEGSSLRIAARCRTAFIYLLLSNSTDLGLWQSVHWNLVFSMNLISLQLSAHHTGEFCCSILPLFHYRNWFPHFPVAYLIKYPVLHLIACNAINSASPLFDLKRSYGAIAL